MFEPAGAGGRHRRLSRPTQCGSKGNETAYDPQIGQAAQQSAQTAAQTQAWAQNYYDKVITPLLNQESSTAATTEAEQQKLFDINEPIAQAQADQYMKYGLPATTDYYNMVKNFSGPQYAEQQAQAALGDQRTAEATQRTTLNQNMAAAGINRSSPEALATMGSMGVSNAAAEAAAMTRARNAAQQLGIQLTSDAVNVANGGASNVVNSTGAASNTASAGLGAAATATGSANQSSGTMLNADNIAGNIYGNNLNAYSRLGAADIQASAQADAGIGQFLGGVAGMFKFGIPSDRRLKYAISRIGEMASGLALYEFKYIWGGLGQIGVMADEVLKVIPEAVVRGDDGFLRVNYSLLR
ncbi:MAG: tail fiber domain-containing protein [Caldimonas sp.]